MRGITSGVTLLLACTSIGLYPGVSHGVGPDLAIGGIGETMTHGDAPPVIYTLSGSSDIAYIFNFLTCNLGDAPASFQTNPPLHPATGQSMFRLKGGRFEQIGVSWIHHNYCALQNNFCNTCTPSQNCGFLGVGCTTINSAGNAGSMLAPRSQINAAAGTFQFPSPITSGGIPTSLDGRIRVHRSDIAPASNPGALYFVEASFTAADDANPYNNASHRQIGFTTNLTVFSPNGPGGTVIGNPAIFAWQAADATVELDPIVIPNEGGPGHDGVFWIGSKVTEVSDSQWDYEYAVYNLSSDCSGGAWTIPVPAGVTVTDVGFHDVDYSGPEPVDGTDWAVTSSAGQIHWSTQSFDENPNANAIRWGTLYNFRFSASTPPVEGPATLGLFKNCGDPTLMVQVPTPSAPTTCHCPGDVNADGAVNASDLPRFVAMYLGVESASPCADGATPTNGDLDDDDVQAFVEAILSGTACP